MPNDVSVVPDPFVDDDFAPLDLRGEGGGSLEDELNRIAAEENTPIGPVAPVDEEPVPPVTPTPAPDAADEPKVYEYADGSSVTIEHGSRGWKATLDSNTGANPEVFYGGTKEEVLVNLSAGKISATQEIRKLNKKLKFEGVAPIPAPAAPVAETVFGRDLTADEIFELKTDLASNPDLAFDKWFQKKTGMKVGDLVRMAKTGKAASDELSAEAVSKEFLGAHPAYEPYEKNFTALISWLCKYKLHQPLSGRDPNDMVETLFTAGFWTVDSLNEAYEDLVEDGLLDLKPEEAPPAEVVEPEPVPVTPAKPVAPVKPATPAPRNDRIVREVKRPRAGQGNLGIRTAETTAGSADLEDMRPPTVEELDNLKDDEVNALFANIRKLRLGTRR
jgi:hypothetical protein